MINPSTIKKSVWAVFLLAIPIFLLSSCGVIIGPLMRCTGTCSSIKALMTKTQWNPAVLTHENCTNISGKYRWKSIEPYHDDLMTQFYHLLDDPYEFIHAIRLSHRGRIPYQFILDPTEGNPSRKRLDWSEFYKNSFVLINQDKRTMLISLMDNTGKTYEKLSISLDSPLIGCDGKYFIIRSLMFGRAKEQRFEKLADGRLQITVNDRDWLVDTQTPKLIGLNQDGTINDNDTPREKTYTQTFEGVP